MLQKVIIVENSSRLGLTERLLQENRHTACCADSGDRVLDLLKEQVGIPSVEVVMVGQFTEGLRGIKLIKEIRRVNGHVEIWMVPSCYSTYVQNKRKPRGIYMHVDKVILWCDIAAQFNCAGFDSYSEQTETLWRFRLASWVVRWSDIVAKFRYSGFNWWPSFSN